MTPTLFFPKRARTRELAKPWLIRALGDALGQVKRSFELPRAAIQLLFKGR